MILILTIFAILILVGFFTYFVSSSSSSSSSSSDSKKTVKLELGLQLIVPNVPCKDKPVVNDPKLVAYVPVVDLHSGHTKMYNVSLDSGSNNFLLYDKTEVNSAKQHNFSTCSLGGCVNALKDLSTHGFTDRPIGIGWIQSGTAMNWCENVMGLLEPVYGSESGLEVVNWNRFSNFSIDLRKGKMKLTFNDLDVPQVHVQRFFQSPDLKYNNRKMFPGNYYAFQIDSFELENGKSSGPFYYIIDVASMQDLIPKNLLLWENYVGQRVTYKIGGRALINTNMNNIKYHQNYLIDKDGTTLHAGAIGINSMMGLKWFFYPKTIGISL